MSKLDASMEAYLAQLGLCRKTIVRDGSCLFRAVSEKHKWVWRPTFECFYLRNYLVKLHRFGIFRKLFLTQQYHHRIRRNCAEYLWGHRDEFEPLIEGCFEEKLFRLQNSKEWAGQVEMMALSRLYGVDFIIFQRPENPPANVTQNNFYRKILLYFVDGVHYDIIYPRSFIQAAALCQSILYEILYHNVFGLTTELEEAVLFIRHQKKNPKEVVENGCTFFDAGINGENGIITRHLVRSTPPLPYRIAKALDPVFFRNVELDIIQEEKREAKLRNQLGRDLNGFAPGDKCQVLLPAHSEHLYNAHIQHLSENEGPVEVFIEELGEKKTVPYSSLRNIAIFTKNGTILTLDGKSKRKKVQTAPSDTVRGVFPWSSFRRITFTGGVMPVVSTDTSQHHYHISPNRSPTPPSPRHLWTPNSSRRQLDMGRRMSMIPSPLPENTEVCENGHPYCPVVASAQHPTVATTQASIPVSQPPVYLIPVINTPFASTIGQVNFTWGVSQDPYGKDLPLSDMNTLRYFYNLGYEYSRILSNFQQSQPPLYPPLLPPTAAVTLAQDVQTQALMTSPYDQGQCGMKNDLNAKKQISSKSTNLSLPSKSEARKTSGSESDSYREKEAEEETCLSSDSGCVSECSGSLSPSKLESSAEEGDMEGRQSTGGEIEAGTMGTVECIGGGTADAKGKVKRKYYMYGNHKLVKPIKEIPPRFQVMLAETSAAKARCEGQPIYIQHTERGVLIDRDNASALNANANCFIPGQNMTGSMEISGGGLPAGITFMPCTSFQMNPSQHSSVQSVTVAPSSTAIAPTQPLFSVPPPNSMPPSSGGINMPPVSSTPAATPACPPLTSLPNTFANGGGSCYYVYPSSSPTGFAPLPGTPSQGQGQVVYMVGPSYPTAPIPAYQHGLHPSSYGVGVTCPAAAQ